MSPAQRIAVHSVEEPSHGGVRALCCDDEAPRGLSFAAGELAIFSRSGPGRSGPNEDAALAMPLGADGALLVVADGMGGRRAGARASGLVIETVEEFVEARREGEATWVLVAQAIEEAGRRIRGKRLGAGTTAIAAVLEQGTVRFIHSGDSQGMLIGQRGRVKSLTVAHSPVGYAVESGVLDYDEALFHPARHLLSNAVGVGHTRIEVGAGLVFSGRDTILVGSDGLFDNLFGAEVVELSRRGGALVAAKRMARLVGSRMTDSPDDGDEVAAPSKPDDLTFMVFKPKSPNAGSKKAGSKKGGSKKAGSKKAGSKKAGSKKAGSPDAESAAGVS